MSPQKCTEAVKKPIHWLRLAALQSFYIALFFVGLYYSPRTWAFSVLMGTSIGFVTSLAGYTPRWGIFRVCGLAWLLWLPLIHVAYKLGYWQGLSGFQYSDWWSDVFGVWIFFVGIMYVGAAMGMSAVMKGWIDGARLFSWSRKKQTSPDSPNDSAA